MKKVQSNPSVSPAGAGMPAGQPPKWFSKPWLRKWWPALAGGAVALVAISYFTLRSGPTRSSAFARETFPLLQQESVQQDLGMTMDQVARITLISQQRRDAREGMTDLSREEREKKAVAESYATEKEIRDILDKEQVVRLKQISLQLRGTRVWGEEEVVRTLKLTHDQRVQLAVIRDEYDNKRGELRKVEDQKEQKKKADELKKSIDERLLAVLDDGQLAKWQDLVGPPFVGEIKRFGGDRGPGGGTGGGRRGGGGNNKAAAPKTK